MNVSIGTRLAHYEITAAIGKGGMGEVFRAKDTKLGRDVAIKVLPEEFTKDAERLARFEREARVLASLDHSGIASIYGLEEVEGTRFLVMQLAPGEDLSERLSRGPIPIDESLKIAKQIDFPAGYGLELGGASREQKEIFTEMGIALVMGIGLMYFTLVIQFGSFTAPLPIMLSLPLSLIGVVLALLATKGTLNLMSLIGVIMLMGLVAKNAILLLDCARKEEERGVDREEALMHAGRVRLRPILMTTFALIAGMLPVAIGLGEGGEFYRPMAIAIIGGTITSTILTLLVVPTFYDSIEIARDRAIAKFHVREARGNAFIAFVLTFLEAILALLLIRLIYRLATQLFFAVRRRIKPNRVPEVRAAPMQGD